MIFNFSIAWSSLGGVQEAWGSHTAEDEATLHPFIHLPNWPKLVVTD